jgi:hypothetical protein
MPVILSGKNRILYHNIDQFPLAIDGPSLDSPRKREGDQDKQFPNALHHYCESIPTVATPDDIIKAFLSPTKHLEHPRNGTWSSNHQAIGEEWNQRGVAASGSSTDSFAAFIHEENAGR